MSRNWTGINLDKEFPHRITWHQELKHFTCIGKLWPFNGNHSHQNYVLARGLLLWKKCADFELIPQTNKLIFIILFQKATWPRIHLSLKQMFWKYVLKCVKLTLWQQHFLRKGKYCYLEASVFISLFKYYTRFIVPVFYIRLLIRKLKSTFQIVKYL